MKEYQDRAYIMFLERVDDNRGQIRKERSSRVAKKMNKKHMSQLKTFFNHHHGVSQRQMARKFNCSYSNISRTLKNKTNIRYFKKNTIPCRTYG